MTKLLYPELSYSIQGAFYDVYNKLRYLDLSEEGWERALLLALRARGHQVERQVEYELCYKGRRVGRFFIDLLVDGKVLLELKATNKLIAINVSQVITYLKATQLQLGILVNFAGANLEYRRIPNFVTQPAVHQENKVENASLEQYLYPELTHELRSTLYEVHGVLGTGFMHMHYRRATQAELRLRTIPFRRQKEITLFYQATPIETRKVYLLVVDDKVLLAPMAVQTITPQIKGRFRQYLKLLELELGIVANFHGQQLQMEMVRVDASHK
ncbi:MAG: GxxExxY protein [Caldilineaceae bacterium]